MMSQVRHTVAEPANPTYAYISAFIDELWRAGVHHTVVCPGSRSTPLALALAQEKGIRLWTHVDERSAAYFGLGLAKRLGEPVALVCTSGTAAANFLPAVVEAHLSHLPLLVLTADRPHELRDCGAPQAIDQNRLYGAQVKWYVEVAPPEATNEALRYIRALAGRAAATARAVPTGPVHLNFPLREPLTPERAPLPPAAERDPLAWQGRGTRLGQSTTSYVRATTALPGMLAAADNERLVAVLRDCRRGLIVVGPRHCDEGLAEALLRLGQQLGFPILADPLSSLRGTALSRAPSAPIVSSYDALLRSERFVEQATPELVLRFGPMPTSKAFLLYLRRYPHCRQIVIDGQAGWEEPMQLASEVIQADPESLACWLLQANLHEPPEHTDVGWRDLWLQADAVARLTLAQGVAGYTEPFEGRIFTELADLLPEGATLFVGNSMPVRDCDTFFWPQEKRIYVLGNRGASGIDGVLSTALGVAARTPAEPVVLVIGDLSFYHDLNGLLAAKLHGLQLTVVLVNNDGGGIFSFLPQADYPEHFERLFGTPLGLDYAPTVAMYGGRFARASTWEAFRAEVAAGLHMSGVRVVELRTERASNVTMHRALWPLLERALLASGVLGRSGNVPGGAQ
jgi:2-succinyl-5-enolpyruvyl-6-hydroxy-3-cyclohexene-1-carboxylate synthase